MFDPVPCLRRTEPSAALMPRRGQSKLVYVPAAETNISKRTMKRPDDEAVLAGAGVPDRGRTGWLHKT